MRIKSKNKQGKVILQDEPSPTSSKNDYSKIIEPFKVIHVNDIGYEIFKDNLIKMFRSFRIIMKIIMFYNKNQAFLLIQEVI